MKELKMFMFEGCPHCKRAEQMIESLLAAFVRIDEKKEPELADKYDYYYVPCFFAGDEKIAEGAPTEENVAKAFAAACNG